MPRSRLRTPVLLNVALFLLLEGAALALLQHASEVHRSWIFRPFQQFQASVWGSMEQVRTYFSLQEENERLAAENHVLLSGLYGMRERAAEGEDVPSRPSPFEVLSARVVRYCPSGQHAYFIIDRGERDGVCIGAGVITSRGALGIVDGVSEHNAFVTAFTSAGTTVGARIRRDGVYAPLVWRGTGPRDARLIDLPRNLDAAVGDTVHTSGFSCIFPPDIPLGVITALKERPSGANEADVELFEDLSRVRFVTVALHTEADEIQALQTR